MQQSTISNKNHCCPEIAPGKASLLPKYMPTEMRAAHLVREIDHALSIGDIKLCKDTLFELTQTKGISNVARDTGLDRINIYRVFSKAEDIKLGQLCKLLAVHGLALQVKMTMSDTQNAACEDNVQSLFPADNPNPQNNRRAPAMVGILRKALIPSDLADDIVCVRQRGSGCEVCDTGFRKTRIELTIDACEQKLDAHAYVRINPHVIANVQYIQRIVIIGNRWLAHLPADDICEIESEKGKLAISFLCADRILAERSE